MIPLRKAIETARDSPFRQRLGAVIFNKNQIYTAKCNRIRYHKDNKGVWKCSLHAEQAALFSLPREVSRGKDILVVRVMKNGQLGMAFPCDMCMAEIVDRGIRSVYYSDEEGKLSRWRVNA